MERYKMLVTGKNDLIIDEMFARLRDVFDILCCSARFDDRIRHIDLFMPDVFVICLNDESINELCAFSDLKRKLTSCDVLTVVIGKDEECENFEKRAIQMADLILKRPITADQIREEIMKLLAQQAQERELRVLMAQRLEQLKKQQEKKHVLVIDDDSLMLKLIKEYLGETYTVATAISGKIAHKFLETRETNLILLDYEMPEENGVEVLKKIRENEKLAQIPVIFLTGITDRQKLVEALVMKPQGYLIKPVDKEKLIGTIEKFIG